MYSPCAKQKSQTQTRTIERVNARNYGGPEGHSVCGSDYRPDPIGSENGRSKDRSVPS